MIQNAKQAIKAILPLAQELETYLAYREDILSNVKKVEAVYKQGRYNYSQYEKAINNYTGGRPVKEVLTLYDNYINYLKLRIRQINSQIIQEVYNDNSKIDSSAAKIMPAPAKRAAEEIISAQEEKKTAAETKKPSEAKKPTTEVRPTEARQGKTVSIPTTKTRTTIREEETFTKETTKTPDSDVEYLTEKPKTTKKTEKSAKLPISADDIGTIAGIELPESVRKKLAERTFLGDRTEIPENLVESETLRIKNKLAGVPSIEYEALEREARRVVKKVETKKIEKVYKPSALGSVANLFVRGLGYFAIQRYPALFEKLYTALRLANIGTLSNTYVNIIIFSGIVTFFLAFAFFLILLAFTTYTFGELFLKTFVTGVLVSLSTVIFAYYYPFARISQRSKNIGANLPFAINHMGAIASSGLPPDIMFRLVSQTDEYGELGVELRKIVEYIDLFGYDLVTAVDTVAINTPNPQFKEMLGGVITTIQSGGDLKEYFAEKTEEIMEAYKIDKEKSIQTIGTYSDIYTGIMVSAPLFFISILSLVSILGGKIAGIDVQIVISAGTYLVLPLVNIGFLFFLTLVQPDI